MFLIIDKWIPVNKTEKQQKKQTKKKHLERLTTLEAQPTCGRKNDLLLFFIAFPLNENNVVQSWFT